MSERKPTAAEEVRRIMDAQRLELIDEPDATKRRIGQLSIDLSEPMLLRFAASKSQGVIGLAVSVSDLYQALSSALVGFAYTASDGDPKRAAELFRIILIGLQETHPQVEPGLAAGNYRVHKSRDTDG